MYRALFLAVLQRARKELHRRRPLRFKNPLLSMDASLVQLCLSLFPWAANRQTKGAVKLHMLHGHEEYFPSFACITDGKVSDVAMAREVLVDPQAVPTGSIVVFDRAYIDFSLFAALHARGISYVTRLK